MRKIAIYLFVASFILVFVLYTKPWKWEYMGREIPISGTIINRGYEAPVDYRSGKTSGTTDPVYFIYLKTDKSKTIIRVNVNVPTYYMSIGSHVTFNLSDMKIREYHNGDIHVKDL